MYTCSKSSDAYCCKNCSGDWKRMYFAFMSGCAFGGFSGRAARGCNGAFGVAAMFSPLAGPFLGGYLTDYYSWQWVFIINIPLCMLSFLLIKLFVKSDKPPKQKYRKKFDIVGFMSVVVAMGCMQVVLDKGQQYNWFDTPWICWLTGICIFSFILFYVWELEYKYPIIDIRVFKDKNFLFGTCVSSFLNIMLYSTLLVL